MSVSMNIAVGVLGAFLIAAPALAQAPAPPQYGLPIGAAAAKKAVAAAIAEHDKTGAFPMVIAVVDTGGHLVYLERMDNAQIGSVRIAIAKARSAALFRRPTKVFEDALAGGRQAILGLPGAIPSEGGVPITSGGKIIGAIGASGGTAPQDGQVAGAGAKAAAQ